MMASGNKFMLATRDNTRERQRAAADVVPAEEAGKWFTRPEVAAALRVSVSTVDRMVKSEELPCVRVGRRVLFYWPDVIEALRKGDRKFGRKAELNTEAAEVAERDGGKGRSHISDLRFESRDKTQKAQ